MHWAQRPNFRHLWWDPHRAHLRKGTKLASGSCIRESESLLGKPSSAPMRVCSVKQRFLVCPLALRLPYGQGGSRLPPAPWAVVLCWWSLELELKTKRALVWGEGGWGLKRPRVHWPHYPNFRQLGRDPARAHLRKGTKLASGSCIHESETLLVEPSSAPMRVCSGKQRFPFSHQGLCLP